VCEKSNRCRGRLVEGGGNFLIFFLIGRPFDQRVLTTKDQVAMKRVALCVYCEESGGLWSSVYDVAAYISATVSTGILNVEAANGKGTYLPVQV
jgi:hypothetical protein